MTPTPSPTSRRELRTDDGLLDRLVDGELDDRRRADLLRRLDAEPDGWRRCAAAFLEAQGWTRALHAERECSVINPSAAGRWRPLRRMSGIAAAVMVAFVTGFVARGGSRPSTGATPYVIEAPPAPPARPAATAASRVEQLSLVEAPPAAQPPALPEYVRRQLQRQGYEVRGDRKLVSVALKDGRQVTVPVETYTYRFVGHRLY